MNEEPGYASAAPARVTVRVDNSAVLGPIKPLNGVNNAPFYYGSCGHLHYLKEARIPFSRLHDTCGPYGCFRYVDIPNIFRDFGADADDPACYDFTATDILLNGISENGTEVIFRLGVSIENDATGVVYRIFPPDDFEKWAEVCEHVILHYNEGWAGGFHLGIKYWEIWNEPDNEPEIADNPQWRGTKDQFFELYRVTANRLKNRFPGLKIGGYGSCGFYSVVQKQASPDAHESPRMAYFTEFYNDFLEYISRPATAAPLDFFSWHSYACEDDCVKFAGYARQKLDEYGFTDAESIFDEWNCGPGQRGTLKDASDVASMMITMQDSAVDIMAYYCADFYSTYGGLFDPMRFKPLKAYYSMKAFGELRESGQAVLCEITDIVHAEGSGDCRGNPPLKALASENRVMLANRTSSPLEVHLEIRGAAAEDAERERRVFITDETHDLGDAGQETEKITLPPYAVALVRY